MFDRDGTTPSTHAISRQKEKDRALIFIGPVMIPMMTLAYFIVLSIKNGRDEFEPLRRFMVDHETISLGYMLLSVALVMYSLYVIVIKDVVEAWKQARTEQIMAKFAPLYRRRMSRGEAIAYYSVISASAILVAFVAWLHLFR